MWLGVSRFLLHLCFWQVCVCAHCSVGIDSSSVALPPDCLYWYIKSLKEALSVKCSPAENRSGWCNRKSRVSEGSFWASVGIGKQWVTARTLPNGPRNILPQRSVPATTHLHGDVATSCEELTH